MAKDNIVIVDDEKDMREFLEIMLKKDGYDVHGFSSAQSAIEYCRDSHCDLAITDLKMPGMNGVDFIKSLKEASPEALVIMITAYASVDTAIEAMKAGAYDYFTKPFKVDEIKLNIKKALRLKRLEKENRLLKNDLKSRFGFSGIVGTSKKMNEVYALIMSVARTRSSVFITGESGTGKELAARAIHNESDRRDAPFVAINCGAIPDNLIESELFGYQRGAFTGAVSNKEGLVEQASGGTLFLDEITELPVHLQVKLLRFIQERSFRRIGGTADITVDIRLIAASNRDIEAEVKAGRFREDLFYRLNVIRLSLPALRDRKEDIPQLARYFLEKHCNDLGKDIKVISEAAMRCLVDYDYSGNVRELANIMERAVTLESAALITVESLPPNMLQGRSSAQPLSGASSGQTSIIVRDGGIDLEKAMEGIERAALVDALKRAGGVKTKAAELLGLSFRSMRYKLSKYKLTDDDL